MQNIMAKIIRAGSYYGFGEVTSYIVAGGFAVIGVCVSAYIIKWCSSKFKVKEISIVDKAKIENEKDENSIFDKLMDEIVYFFEATKYDTVFIEDLDRFDSTQIFVKLRELNTILNNYDLIKRRIVFVYAIKDDMFRDEERTKFFDFIIPVIPIINSTNSGEVLRDKLDVKKQKDGTTRSSLFNISSSFITQISPFIEDMRVLTSICNEFILYKHTLNSEKLKDEEMFSIIVFKNLFPSEFAELESERGVVKDAFEEKRKYISNKQKELVEKKEELVNILNGIERDILCDVREVKAAFLDYLSPSKPFINCEIDKNYSRNEIMNDEFDMNLFRKNIKINDDGYRRFMRQIEEGTDKRVLDYLFRIQCLRNNEESRKEEMQKEIEECTTVIDELYTYSLKALIEKFGGANIFSNEVTQNKFLVFLLRKGFINENYADYINYFHPHSITKDEMNFIRGIRMQDAAGNFNYMINNVDEVCNRIEAYEFKQSEALNFDITDYLITKKKNDGRCKTLFEGLSVGDDKHDEFIRAYIERKKNVAAFINLLCKFYKNYWVNIAKSKLITEDSKFNYLFLILEHAELEDILDMNNFENMNCISNFVVGNRMSLQQLSKVDSKKMSDIINQLDICFENVDIKGSDKDVLNYIFENNKYVLNLGMVQSLFELCYPNKVKELKTAHYTTLLEVKYEPLLNRIYDDFEDYVSVFVVGQESNLNESLNSIEDILERLFEDNYDLCTQVLDKSNIVWDEIDKCCNCVVEKSDKRMPMWNYVLKKEKVNPSWSNFVKYYDEYGIRDTLLEWVSNCIDLFLCEERIAEFTDAMLEELVTADISIDAFRKIIEIYHVEQFDCELSAFDAERIDILVENDWIPFTSAYFEQMSEEAPQEVFTYITHNKEEFIEIIDTVSLDVDLIAELTKSNTYADAEKTKIINLLQPEDMNQNMALVIQNLAIPLKKICVETAWDLLEQDKRYQLLLNQLEVYSVEEISEKFSSLAPVYQALSDISRRHKEYLDINDYNRNLLIKLKKKDYITSYQEEDINIGKHKEQVVKRFRIMIKQKQ